MRSLYGRIKGDINSVPCSDQVRDIWDEKWPKHKNPCVWEGERERTHTHLGTPHKTGLSSWKYNLWELHFYIKRVHIASQQN